MKSSRPITINLDAIVVTFIVLALAVLSPNYVNAGSNTGGRGGTTTLDQTPPSTLTMASTRERLPYFTKAGYGVDVFECDATLSELSEDERQKKKKKIPGTTYRVCFRPNQEAIDADVGIHSIDEWTWDTTYDGGVAVMNAITDGKGDGILSDIKCQPDGSICRLDSMLPSNFHLNAGTVVGEGRATLSDGQGSVFVHKDLFQAEFKFTMPELPEQKIQQYMVTYKVSEEAQVATEADTQNDKYTEEQPEL